MEPKHLVQLAAILDSGSIRAAAGRLNLTQSTLTRNIQTLEMQAGGSLFARSRHGVRQTTLGAALAREGRSIARAVWVAEQAATRHGLGLKRELRIGVGPLFANNVMNKVAQDLVSRHPELSLQIRVDTPYRLFEQMHDDALDLVIAPRVQSPTQELDCELLLEDRLVVVAAKHHPLASGAPLQVADLEDRDWINMGTYARFEESPVERLQAAGIHRLHTPIALSGDAVICLNILSEGRHLSLMPQRLTQRVAADYGLTVLDVDADFGQRNLYLWHRLSAGDPQWVATLRAALLARLA